VPKQYCGQAYDDKHAWKDLELEFDDYLAGEKKKISTLHHIPTIPQHTTNVTPFKRTIIKAPDYNEVRQITDNYPLIESTSLTQKSIRDAAYHIPHTTYHIQQPTTT